MGLFSWFIFLNISCCAERHLVFYVDFLSYNFTELLNYLCVESLELSTYKRISSTNRGIFISFEFGDLELINLLNYSKIYSTTLNKNAQSEDLFLVPDLSGKTFSFPSVSMVSTMGFSFVAFILLRKILPVSVLLKEFVRKHCCILSWRGVSFCLVFKSKCVLLI